MGASERVKELALAAGFDLAGIAPAGSFEPEGAALVERIDAGLFSGLPWFTPERAAVAADPRSLLPEAQSIVCVALSYDTGAGPAGVVARYAWGADYHDVMRKRLESLRQALEEEFGRYECRTFVDTGRLVDRAAAVRGGLGWYGKNTNLLNSRLGSWLFLGALVTTLDLQPDTPVRQHCGSCRACLDVCPTGALIAPYVLDNNRCISFLTIELRGPIPRELRAQMGSYIFGCDLCQDVCPVNGQAAPVRHLEFAAGAAMQGIEEAAVLLELDDAAFRKRFAASPVKRAKRSGLLRNVCVALGNSGQDRAVGPLRRAMRDPDPLVRGHAAWALGRLGAAADLRAARAEETDSYVIEEIDCALTAR